MIRPQQHVKIPAEWNTPEELFEIAALRMRRGLAPPAEIYKVQYRSHFNWLDFPAWAQPSDPDAFDGCCHEG